MSCAFGKKRLESSSYGQVPHWVLSAWGGLDCALNIAKPSLLDWQYAAYSGKCIITFVA
jgi:hypothetical protein